MDIWLKWRYFKKKITDIILAKITFMQLTKLLNKLFSPQNQNDPLSFHGCCKISPWRPDRCHAILVMTDKQEGTLSPDTAPDIGRNNMMASRPIVKQLLSDKAVVKKIHLG